MSQTKNPTTTAAAVSSENTSVKSRLPPYIHSLQQFRLVWLDASINEVNNKDYINTISKLKEVVTNVNTFTDVDECIDFISEITDENIFMISSGAFARKMVPVTHEMAQVSTIYILGGNKARQEEWAKHWSKVKGVFTDITSICETLPQTVQRCSRNTISMSFVAPNSDTTKQNLDELDQSFMYTQILKEILLTIDFEPKHIKEFITYCREQFACNTTESTYVDKLKQEYHQHVPIWWYTSPSFLYSMLNHALRTMAVDLIVNMGFFVRDLHQHIVKLHSEQYRQGGPLDTFVVYRGQGLSQTDFDQIVKMQGGLLSFNNFLSTSFDRAVSFAYAESNHCHPDTVGVLFRITTDASISSTPFANVRNVSYFQDEEEILFSMHSVFRIAQFEKIDGNDRLWQVNLTLTSDHDPQLHTLTEYIRKEIYPNSKGWDRLGQLLIKLGQFDKAQQVYEIMLHHIPTVHEKANIYNMLGLIKNHRGEYAEAIRFYEISTETGRKGLCPTDVSLATPYSNIGVVYSNMAEYSKAISSHEKALEICRNTLPPNHPDLAASYNNIGLVYAEIGEYSKALSSHEKTLEIYHKTLPPNHPSLAASYNNIGLVYSKTGEYSKALSSHQKALEMRRKTLPQNHPSLATSYNNIGLVYSEIGEYSKALSTYEKTLEIRQKTLPPDHPSLATSYNNIGSMYSKIGEYSKALSSYEKALEIQRKTLPPDHPDLVTTYTIIGLVYEKMSEYSKAISFLERTLVILQRSVPADHPNILAIQRHIQYVEMKL